MALGLRIKRKPPLDLVADRVRNIVIENADAIKVMKRLHNANHGTLSPVLFYCDPPYIDSSRKSSGEYVHDDFDHAAFLDAVLELNNASNDYKFAISGYPNPLYEQLLSGWHKVKTETFVSVANAAVGSDRRRTEVLWRNYDVENRQQKFEI